MSRLAKQEKNTRRKKKKGGGECACLFVRTKLSYSWGSKSIPLRFLRLRLLRVPPSIVPDSFAIVAPPPNPQTNPHTHTTPHPPPKKSVPNPNPNSRASSCSSNRDPFRTPADCRVSTPILLQEVEKPIPACC